MTKDDIREELERQQTEIRNQIDALETASVALQDAIDALS